MYLSGICLVHIVHGLPDSIDDKLLQLVCRGIRCQQGKKQRPRLPITINCLRSLKEQLRLSNYSLMEQQTLWAAFALAFYGFLCISEYTTYTLHWSDVPITEEKLSIILHQSKTDPFKHGHTINIYLTNSSTCPLHAF